MTKWRKMMYSFNMVLLGEINNKQCFTKMLMVQLNIQRTLGHMAVFYKDL